MAAQAGLNIGKIYPAMTSGTAACTAGSVVVTFNRPFQKTPSVIVDRLSNGTTIVQGMAGGVSTTGFTIVTLEHVIGETLGTTVGTSSADTFTWWAFVDN